MRELCLAAVSAVQHRRQNTAKAFPVHRSRKLDIAGGTWREARPAHILRFFGFHIDKASFKSADIGIKHRNGSQRVVQSQLIRAFEPSASESKNRLQQLGIRPQKFACPLCFHRQPHR